MADRHRLGIQDALWLEMDRPSFTLSTYNGKVVVGIACDKTLVPDHGTIVDGFAFERLLAATPASPSE